MIFDYKDYARYKDKICMICRCKDDAVDFCDVLDSLGKRWCSSRRYIHEDGFNSVDINKGGIAYFFNEGTRSDVEFAMYFCDIALEYSDFDWDATREYIKTGKKSVDKPINIDELFGEVSV